MWKLVIEDDEGKRTVVPLSREQYSIGRKDGNTIRLTERNVSREHARLLRKANGSANGNGNGAVAHVDDKQSFVLEDLTSYNGVFVNGLRITHAQDLSHGDLVQIGDYRIVLQDETLLDTAVPPVSDSKQTIPQAPNSRAAALLDRPHRFVMLAGPTPGTEYPLDTERMTIGRAEDASISINHNSVSRLHCEVHALGDGRFEIVDKGSSNGVRVNGSDLRRGIVEPGDVIELGDVKFKFIAAGQIFRPTESQQLALLSDRAAADLVASKRRANTAIPVAVFAVVVVAGAVGAWVTMRPKAHDAPAAVAVSADQAALDDAKAKCAAGDCEAAHEELSGLPAGSTLRTSAEFKDVMGRWADQLLAKGDAETDSAKKHVDFQRVAQDAAVDGARRKAAADRLQALDAVASNPVPAATVAAAAPPATTDDNTPPPAPTKHAPTTSDTSNQQFTGVAVANPPPTPTPPTPVAATTPTRVPGSTDDRERQAALQATTTDAKAAMKASLEQKVYSGRASDTEISLLIATCKELGDKMCVAQARQIRAQRAGN